MNTDDLNIHRMTKMYEAIYRKYPMYNTGLLKTFVEVFQIRNLSAVIVYSAKKFEQMKIITDNRIPLGDYTVIKITINPPPKLLIYSTMAFAYYLGACVSNIEYRISNIKYTYTYTNTRGCITTRTINS